MKNWKLKRRCPFKHCFFSSVLTSSQCLKSMYVSGTCLILLWIHRMFSCFKLSIIWIIHVVSTLKCMFIWLNQWFEFIGYLLIIWNIIFCSVSVSFQVVLLLNIDDILQSSIKINHIIFRYWNINTSIQKSTNSYY